MSVDIYERSPVGSFTREHLISYTSDWEGERFPDGRPRVPDDIVERMRNVTLTQAWGTCNGAGFEFQFEGGFTNTHPGQVLCGRAVTATFMPRRPDCRRALDEQGEKGGHEGDHIHWTINMLVPGDVYVADVFGKIDKGAIIGDNLAASIKAKSGNGVVHDNSVRDIEGIRGLEDFPCFVRGWHPSIAAPTIMLTGMNCPTRIGGCTVMPGDVVLGKGDAVAFIPPAPGGADRHHRRDRAPARHLRQDPPRRGEVPAGGDRRTLGGPHRKGLLRVARGPHRRAACPQSAIQDYLKTRTW